MKIAARALAVLVLDAIALLVLSELLAGFALRGSGAALGAAALVGATNALVWPILWRLSAPRSVLALGLTALLLNALLVTLAIELIPGADIDGLAEGVVVTVGLTLLTALFGALLAIGDDETWERNVLARAARRAGEVVESDVPGLLMIEIDGLAHEVVVRALRDGTMPNLARWVTTGSHRLERWETDLSSQTGACQAGILLGSNEDVPAFRWWEKERGRAMITYHPRDAQEIERRCSDGRGLLHADGASRANIFSGDAPHSMLTMSTVLVRRRPLGHDYAAYFAHPYALLKTAGSTIADFWRERRAAARQRRRDVRPRVERSRKYAALRAYATAIQLDLQVAAVIGDLLAGRPVIYTTFLAYDELAHHSGLERHDTLEVLAKVDAQIGRIASAFALAPRPYELVVLSDHGQSQGANFRQRYGQTLGQLVDDLIGGRATTHSQSGGEDEASAYLGAGLTELGRDEGSGAAAVRAMTRKRSTEGAVVLLDSSSAATEGSADGDEPPEVAVLASGNLGLISFAREPGRLSLERIEALYPGIVEALRRHPGIGFVLVRSESRGPLALGASGSHALAAGTVEGDDPLAPFGPNAAAHLRRTDGFEHCPDLLVNSRYWPETEEVAAFEEFVGSHGGMGGPMSFPFLCHPAHLKVPAEPIVGAEQVHRVLRGWLAELGQDAYAD